jgi:formate dehydrogenase subunit gamma
VLLASPVWRCSTRRCSGWGACSAAAERPRHPSLDRRGALLQLPRSCSFASGRLNLWERTDNVWLSKIPPTFSPSNEENLPEVGKYNAGQKLVFWSMSILIILLITSGLVIWEQYFAASTTIDTKRIAVLGHSFAGIAIICVWIIHVYAAIWVRGTMQAMTKGTVTGGWAWKHHRRWLRDLAGGKPSA